MKTRTKNTDIIAREGYVILVISVIVAFVFYLWHAWAGTVATVWYLFCLYFFRNPPRVSHEQGAIILCSADGKVIAIADAMEPDFLKIPRQRITIFMSPFNVHVNRSPVEGQVLNTAYHQGKFSAAFKDTASQENERSALHVKTTDGDDVVFVQIAGWFARRIVTYPQVGEALTRGQIIGVIKFGSRMDVYLPPGYAAAVEVGQKVKAGHTLIARKQS